MSESGPATLLYLATHPESTTTDIAQAVFDPDTDDELRNADRKVRYYLTEKYDRLVDQTDNSPARFAVDRDKVTAGVGEIEIQAFDGTVLGVGLGGVVLFESADGETTIEVVPDIHPED